MLKIGKLYIVPSWDNQIIQILDRDFETPKKVPHYLVKPIIPAYFEVYSYTGKGKLEGIDYPIWLTNLPDNCEELPDTHPAYILYAK